MTISPLNYYASALPAAQALENSIAIAVNNSRLQGIHHDINKAQTDNSFERTKELLKGFDTGKVK
jgi:hypothetical protein